MIIIILIVVLFSLYMKKIEEKQKTTKIKELPVCGNNLCELGEDSNLCCLDCACESKNMYCDTKENSCRYKDLNISFEQAKEIYKNYYKFNDEFFEKKKIMHYNSEHNNELILNFCVEQQKIVHITVMNCISINKNKNIIKSYIIDN